MVFLAGVLGCKPSGAQLPPRPIKHEAYVWQRKHTANVKHAISTYGTNFASLVVLAAEVAWNGTKPSLARAEVDYDHLKSTGVPLGLAVRIGACTTEAMNSPASAKYLADLSASFIREANKHSLQPKELQLDFDAGESQLSAYVNWVRTLKERVPSIPVLITALPAWLDRPAFKHLAAASDGYVLQVHSLRRPRNSADVSPLLNPDEARRAVLQAGKLGTPFRVALPTYSYMVAFDARDGRFLGVSAEGPRKRWPADARLLELNSNPLVIAQLIEDWRRSAHAELEGIIWYRLPSHDDTLNWRWPTLRAMVQGRFPRSSFRVESRRVEPALHELWLVNDGELDISSRQKLTVSWGDARLIAADALRGFEIQERKDHSAWFRATTTNWLRAGESRSVAWLRLSDDREVKIESGEW